MSRSRSESPQALLIAGALVNILLLPGAGTLLVGDTRLGTFQLVLFASGGFLMILSMPLMFILVGFFLMPVAALLMLGAWVWALVTSIQILSRLNNGR